jgi:hypothetical protein
MAKAPKTATPDAVTEESPAVPAPTPPAPEEVPPLEPPNFATAEENARLRAELEAVQAKARELAAQVETLTDERADAQTKVNLLGAELESLRPPPPPPEPERPARSADAAADDPRHVRRLYGF